MPAELVRSAPQSARHRTPHLGQRIHRRADIYGVAAKAVEFGYDQNVSGLQLVHEPGKPSTLSNGGAAGNRLGDNPARFDQEACSFDPVASFR